MLSSNDYIKASTEKWVALAARPDIVGKKVEYHSNRRVEERGVINRIEVKDGRVSIYTSRGGTLPVDGKEAVLFKDFAIDEENDPDTLGDGTIFVDLDDDTRNIQILF